MNWKRVLSFLVGAGCAVAGHYYGVGGLCVAGAATAGVSIPYPGDARIIGMVRGMLDALDRGSANDADAHLADIKKAMKRVRNGVKK
jgi:hypothetical protein